MPNVPAPTSSVCDASSGTRTWKLNPTRLTTVTTVSTTRATGARHAHARPSRIPATTRVPGRFSTGYSSSSRIRRRATSTDRKLTALTTKHRPVPTAAIRSPASAGPITREALKRPELSATAFCSSDWPTIWKVSVCRPGASKTSTSPPSAARAYTTGSVATPASVTTARTMETTIAAPWVARRRRRVSNRSMITPATRPSARNGTKRQNASAPTARGEPESSITSHASAMFCIHVPATETICPLKKSR